MKLIIKKNKIESNSFGVRTKERPDPPGLPCKLFLIKEEEAQSCQCDIIATC